MSGGPTDLLLAMIWEEPVLFGLLVVIFEVPRYTLSLLSVFLFGWKARSFPPISPRVSAIVSVFNGEHGIRDCVLALARQGDALIEIIVIDDGSEDGTWSVLQELCRDIPMLRARRHPRRCGKSAAQNHGARVARGDLVLMVDCDTLVEAGAVARMTRAFGDRRVAAVSGNLLVRNVAETPLTRMQALEYLQGITIGRSFLDQIGALACCSGAFSMFCRSTYVAIGGMNVGPGEDLEFTLRLRRGGHRIRFAADAVATTRVPATPARLVRQRLRWDRDAVAIRVFMYRQLALVRVHESLSDTLQRLDFIVFDLAATLAFPAYMAALAWKFGEDLPSMLWAIYVALLFFYIPHILLAVVAARRRIGVQDVLLLFILPLYQGLVMKFVRFVAFSQELLFAESHRDDFVPRRVRDALYGTA